MSVSQLHRFEIINEALEELKITPVEIIDDLLGSFDLLCRVLYKTDKDLLVETMKQDIDSGSLAHAFATICTVQLCEAENYPINSELTMGMFVEEIKEKFSNKKKI